MKTKNLKYLLLALVALFAIIPSVAKDKGNPQISFSEKKHNFGNIKENGGPVSVEFQFVNTGDANLIIYEASAQCGCTKPEYPKYPIAPGKTGTIKVTYNPIGRPGPFEKIVTVKSNGKTSKTRLKISGTVIPKDKK